MFLYTHRLVGLVVKASASRAEGPGFKSSLRRDFFGVLLLLLFFVVVIIIIIIIIIFFFFFFSFLFFFFFSSSSSSAIDQPWLDPQSTCCQELGGAPEVFGRSPQLVGGDSTYGHNWCLCCHHMEQSRRMWRTVCSASLQSQSAEFMMPVRFRCARRPQCPVRNLNIVVCSCLAGRLTGSVEGL